MILELDRAAFQNRASRYLAARGEPEIGGAAYFMLAASSPGLVKNNVMVESADMTFVSIELGAKNEVVGLYLERGSPRPPGSSEEDLVLRWDDVGRAFREPAGSMPEVIRVWIDRVPIAHSRDWEAAGGRVIRTHYDAREYLCAIDIGEPWEENEPEG